jgi:hypothetical protein
VNLFSTFGEFILNLIDRRDKSFLSTPLQEPEAAGIVDYRGVGKREHRSTPDVVIKSRARPSLRARDAGASPAFGIVRRASCAPPAAPRKLCRHRWVAGAGFGLGYFSVFFLVVEGEKLCHSHLAASARHSAVG